MSRARRSVDAGASIVLSADLKVCAEKATFLNAFVRVGLVPDSGMTAGTSLSTSDQNTRLLMKLEAIQHYGLPHANFISLNGHNEPWVGPEYAETVAVPTRPSPTREAPATPSASV